MGHLTAGQREFAGVLSGLTPLLPRVIGAWCLSEMSGSASAGREADGNHNWLNIAYYDSGPGSITQHSTWRSPEKAAQATNRFLRGQQFGASAGIKAILRKADGKGAMEQIQAICTSGWATNPAYCSLIRGTFRLLADENIPSSGPGASATAGGPGGGNFTTRNQPYTFEVGPHEDYWEASTRLADEVEWALYLDGTVVYYDPEPILLKREPVAEIRRSSPSTLDFSMNWDRRNIATEMSVKVVCDPFKFKAGETVQLFGFGPASVASTGKPEYPGRWLIGEIVRNRFEPFSELRLKQPTRPHAEPAPEQVQERSPTSRGSGPGGNAPAGAGKGDHASMNAQEFGEQVIIPLAQRLGFPETVAGVREENANHQKMTSSGNVSDHWPGNLPHNWAADLSGGNMDKLAGRIAKEFGVPWDGSGLVNHNYAGKRIQLIWRYPDHYDHVHCGVSG